MNRMDATFKRLKREGKKAVVFFVTAGDPSIKVTRQVLRYAEKTGVDLMELGVPFSDSLADGPVIQASSLRAIRRGIDLKRVLSFVRSERIKGLKMPLVLMTSFNVIHRMGVPNFLKAAERSGVDGFILPDLPLHAAQGFYPSTSRNQPYNVLMLSPTTSRERERAILRSAKGFVYYISLTGLTGTRRWKSYPFRQEVRRIRKRSAQPILVGFGVGTPGEARDIARFSDGVIVGSAIVQHLSRYSSRGLSGKSKAWIASFVRGVKS